MPGPLELYDRQGDSRKPDVLRQPGMEPPDRGQVLPTPERPHRGASPAGQRGEGGQDAEDGLDHHPRRGAGDHYARRVGEGAGPRGEAPAGHRRGRPPQPPLVANRRDGLRRLRPQVLGRAVPQGPRRRPRRGDHQLLQVRRKGLAWQDHLPDAIDAPRRAVGILGARQTPDDRLGRRGCCRRRHRALRHVGRPTKWVRDRRRPHRRRGQADQRPGDGAHDVD